MGMYKTIECCWRSVDSEWGEVCQLQAGLQGDDSGYLAKK